jgi:hypothetical protein
MGCSWQAVLDIANVYLSADCISPWIRGSLEEWTCSYMVNQCRCAEGRDCSGRQCTDIVKNASMLEPPWRPMGCTLMTNALSSEVFGPFLCHDTLGCI